MNGDITLTPNLGIRYGHSKDNTYQESDVVGIQHLSIGSKSSIYRAVFQAVRQSSLAPQKIAEGFSVMPVLQASVEHYLMIIVKNLMLK